MEVVLQYFANGNVSPNSTGPGNAHVFYTRSAVDTYSERFRIRYDGGVTFNGDTAAANALDDYEEGTWTPGISGTTAGSFTAGTANSGRYAKIGRFVQPNFKCDLWQLDCSIINWFCDNYRSSPFPLLNVTSNYRAAGIHGTDKIMDSMLHEPYTDIALGSKMLVCPISTCHNEK